MVRISMTTMLAALVAIGPARSVRAEEPAEVVAEPTAAQLSDEAVRQFEQAEYDAAIELFEQAHAKDPQPNYLYNIARVYEEKGDFAAAVEWYQRFVGEPRVDLEARENAIARLKVLRDALEQLRDEPEAAPQRTKEPVPEPEVRFAETPDRDIAPDDRVRKARIAGYTMMGLGGAALVVGGVFGGLALRNDNDANDAEFVDTAMGLRDQARTQARVADGMLVSGGILAGVGLVVVLATLGSKHRRQTAWVPFGGGLGVRHRF
jgi:tetratricopeptide (TPR) repeat protein